MDAALNRHGFWSGTSPYDGAMSYAYTTRDVELAPVPRRPAVERGGSAAHAAHRVRADAAYDWVQVRMPQARRRRCVLPTSC